MNFKALVWSLGITGWILQDFLCNFQQFIFGVSVSKVSAVTRNSESTWTRMEKCYRLFFFFSDQDSPWLAFHVWFALGLNQKSGFSFARWENRSKEKNGCCLAVCLFSTVGAMSYYNLSSLWFTQLTHSTSNRNPHFCAVILCCVAL